MEFIHSPPLRTTQVRLGCYPCRKSSEVRNAKGYLVSPQLVARVMTVVVVA